MTQQPTEPTFAATLRELMRTRNWKQQYVADQIGMNSADVGRWLNGKGITIGNVRKLAALFEVDPRVLEQLAGYGDNNVSSVKDTETIDPSMAALLDAETAEMRRRLSTGGYPRAFWPAIARAWRQMADMADAAIEQASQSGSVSQQSDTQLASDSQPASNSHRRGKRGQRTDLTECYVSPSHSWHFDNSTQVLTALATA